MPVPTFVLAPVNGWLRLLGLWQSIWMLLETNCDRNLEAILLGAGRGQRGTLSLAQLSTVIQWEWPGPARSLGTDTKGTTTEGHGCPAGGGPKTLNMRSPPCTMVLSMSMADGELTGFLVTLYTPAPLYLFLNSLLQFCQLLKLEVSFLLGSKALIRLEFPLFCCWERDSHLVVFKVCLLLALCSCIIPCRI